MKASNIFLRVGLFFILLTTTACIPGITWLPDSNGFVYTTENRSLVHFDVAKRKARTLVEDTETETACPAVSPDGKQVAVARLFHEKGKPSTLQIIIYNMSGKVARRSTPFIYSEAGVSNENEKLGVTILFWSPRENHIIVSDYTSTKPKSSIYDLKTNQLSILPGAHPAPFGDNPIRPDGKGFLVAKFGDKHVAGMSFIDRQGKEHAIPLTPEALNSEDKRDMLAWPFLFTSSWEGSKAVVFGSVGRFEIDTDKYIAKFTSTPQAQLNRDRQLMQQFAFQNSSKVVRVWTITKRNGPNAEDFHRLEIFDSNERKPKTLIQRARSCTLFPSPNRKLVAVRCFDAQLKEGKQSDLILLINHQGEIAARNTVEK
jgi:hypothetical protein